MPSTLIILNINCHDIETQHVVCVSKILENSLCNLQQFKIVNMAKVNIKERNFIIKILKVDKCYILQRALSRYIGYSGINN